MPNPEHVKILKQGVETWNAWRRDVLKVAPDLSWGDLNRADLSGTDLSGADCTQAHLRQANLGQADLSDANFSGADLGGADLRQANLDSALTAHADRDDRDAEGCAQSGNVQPKAVSWPVDETERVEFEREHLAPIPPGK